MDRFFRIEPTFFGCFQFKTGKKFVKNCHSFVFSKFVIFLQTFSQLQTEKSPLKLKRSANVENSAKNRFTHRRLVEKDTAGLFLEALMSADLYPNIVRTY